MVEFTFGRELDEDGTLGKKLEYGIVPKDGHIEFLAGFRVHYPVPIISDYHSGIISGRVALEVVAGKVKAKAYNIVLRARKNEGEKILSFLNRFVKIFDENKETQKLQRRIALESVALEKELNNKVDELFRKHPQYRPFRNNIFVQIKPDHLALTLYTLRTENVRVAKKINTFYFMPPKTGRGDADFDGDPRIKISMKVFVDGRREGVYVKFFMHAREEGPDFTEASGWSNPKLLYQPPLGWKIKGLPGKTDYDLIDQIVRGHNPVDIPTPVGTIRVYADRDGDEAGVWTKMICRFDKDFTIPVAIEKLRDVPKAKTIQLSLPRQMNYIPPHVAIPGKRKGDREYSGAGPAIWVSAKSRIQGNRITFQINMTAYETEDDWTAASGWSTPDVLYTAPPGWTIQSIHFNGKRVQNNRTSLSWPNIVHYVDTNHRPRVDQTEIGRIITYGDRDGDDVLEYTRVVYQRNSAKISVKLKRSVREAHLPKFKLPLQQIKLQTGFIRLDNGKNLNGWTGNLTGWSVAGGVIQLDATKAKGEIYSNATIGSDCRTISMQFRARNEATSGTFGVVIYGKSLQINADGKTQKSPEQWNELQIDIADSLAKVRLNGQPIQRAWPIGTKNKHGIGLAPERGSFEFRRLMIKSAVPNIGSKQRAEHKLIVPRGGRKIVISAQDQGTIVTARSNGKIIWICELRFWNPKKGKAEVRRLTRSEDVVRITNGAKCFIDLDALIGKTIRIGQIKSFTPHPKIQARSGALPLCSTPPPLAKKKQLKSLTALVKAHLKETQAIIRTDGSPFDWRWQSGSTLRIVFLDGNRAVHTKVQRIASEWEKYANIRFDFYTKAQFDNYSKKLLEKKSGPAAALFRGVLPFLAHVTITFKGPKAEYASDIGPWSLVSIKEGKPSMKLVGLDKVTDKREFRRIVLHEFGHALGLQHEHRSPSRPFQWNDKAVMDYFTHPDRGWTEEEVKHNILTQLSADTTNYTKFDPKSIMLYEIRPEWTRNRFSTSRNYELSETDKKYISEVYSAQIGGLILYEDDRFKDRSYRIPLRKNIPSLDKVDFGDEADSMKWNIPRGLCVILYESDNYQKPRMLLYGKGSHEQLDKIRLGDEIDSVRWAGDATLRDPNWKQIPRLGNY